MIDGGKEAGVARTEPELSPGFSHFDVVGDDPVAGALRSISVVLKQNIEAERMLLERFRELAELRARGVNWHEAFQAESQRGLMHQISEVLDRLGRASGSLRRVVVSELRDAGISTTEIADLFGVTHQRISMLIRKGLREQRLGD